MPAVEPVLQVNPSLADDIVGSNEIMVHHRDDQLCLQWEGHGELKHPEIRSRTFRERHGDGWTN